jgi:hypothetical protein
MSYFVHSIKAALSGENDTIGMVLAKELSITKSIVLKSQQSVQVSDQVDAKFWYPNQTGIDVINDSKDLDSTIRAFVAHCDRDDDDEDQPVPMEALIKFHLDALHESVAGRGKSVKNKTTRMMMMTRVMSSEEVPEDDFAAAMILQPSALALVASFQKSLQPDDDADAAAVAADADAVLETEKNNADSHNTPDNDNDAPEDFPLIGKKGDKYKKNYCGLIANNWAPTPADEAFMIRRAIVGAQAELLNHLNAAADKAPAVATSTLLAPDGSVIPGQEQRANISFLHSVLEANRLPLEAQEEFSTMYLAIAGIVEGVSRKQLSIQPFGSMSYGLGTPTSDLDCRIVLNPAYVRAKMLDKAAGGSKPVQAYTGAIPSLWSDAPIPKQNCHLPVLPSLNRFAIVEFFKRIEKNKEILRLQNTKLIERFEVKLLNFQIDKACGFDYDLINAAHASNNPNAYCKGSMQLSRVFDVDLVSSLDQPMAKTQLFRSMIELSPYVYPMLLVTKHWAKQRGMQDSENGFLNSFALNTMVIFYLQTIGELPVLHRNANPNPHINLAGRQVHQTVEDPAPVPLPVELPNIVRLGSSLLGSRLTEQFDLTPFWAPRGDLKIDYDQHDQPTFEYYEADEFAAQSMELGSGLIPQYWQSPITKKRHLVYSGHGAIPRYVQHMSPKLRDPKDESKGYKLLDNPDVLCGDLAHRF